MRRLATVFPPLTLALLLLAGPSARAQTEVTICQVQGSGFQTPLLDQRVVVEGIVTADFVEAPLDGFFIQAPGCDEDPATSDGLWIYDGNRDVAVEVGQTVRVTGRVDEYFDLTEVLLDTMEVVTDTLTTVEPEPLTLPQDPSAAASYLEAREGMLVDVGPLRIVGATNTYGDAYAVPEDSGIERLWRSDAEGRRIGLIFSGTWLRLRHGDVLEGTAAPLTYNYENYKLAFGEGHGLDVERNPDLEVPRAEPAGEGELTLATYNVENLFDPLDDPGKNDEDSTPSAEQYPLEIARRARSIAESLVAPDIIALQEVEKLAVLEDLAAQELLAPFGYEAALIEGPDGRGIDVGFLYRGDRVRLLSLEQAQACTGMDVPEPEIECTQPSGQPGWALFSRPPLIGRFELVDTGGRITLIANHFKSKRGGDAVTTPVRTRMAEHNLALVERERAAAPEVPVMVLGDLNDFEETPPLLTLTRGEQGLAQPWLDTDLVAEDDRYSYIFNGVSQILDYMLPTRDLRVTAFGPVHANTDQGADPPWLEGGESPRASDHDPLLMRIPIDALPVPAPVYEAFLPLLARGLTDETGGAPATAAPPSATPTATNTPSAPPTATPGAGAPPRSPLRIDALFYDGEEPQYEGDEYIAFTNVGGMSLDLTGWQVISVRGDQRYDFPAGFTMAPDQSCRLYTDEDHPEHCGLNWQRSTQPVWRNAGDKAELRDAAGTLVDWFCYGDHEGECGG